MGARSTTGSPHPSSRPGRDGACGRCRATCGFRCRMRLASIACFGQTAASYVGKAASLHHRVNSYFRKQNGVPERSLEMLSQARAISFDVTPSPLEALLEPDEIKRHRPPYNVALTIQDRALWFTSPDLSTRSSRPSPHCPLGPFASAETLDRFGALARGDRAALTSGSRGPDDGTFTPVTSGCAQRILNCRVDLSRTRSCCGLAHACGEKVGETATLMKTTPTKRVAD